MRNTKIVCTLGPASDDRATIRSLAEAGMSVARLNASHGPTEVRAEIADRVRAVDEATDAPLATMVDLRGPEVRTAELEEPIELVDGSEIRFERGSTATADRIGLTHSIEAVRPGDAVLLDDGRIETTVDRVEDGSVVATVDSGGPLDSRKSVTTRGVDLELELIGEQDRREIRMAVEKDADFVAASFVRDADDVYEVAETIENHGGTEPNVIAKIERAAAVENIEGIIDAADGVMVARGDLGVECPLEDVPIIQKRIIRTCMLAGVPVITATEMLDSMIHARRPTRAEASDVANAILDGTDAVMLSAETAVGEYPVRTTETMARIARRIQESEEYADAREQRVPGTGSDVRTDALARSARFLARDVGATAVVAVSESGYTARKAAKFRPSVPIVAPTPDETVRRQLAVTWGVTAHSADYGTDLDGVLKTAVETAVDVGAAESGDTVVVLSGMLTELHDTDATNTLKVHVVAETLASGQAVVAGRVAAPIRRVTDGDLSTLPDGSIVVLPDSFDDQFEGDLSSIVGIAAEARGMTGYPAIVARELGVPMVAGVTIPESVADGAVVTLDGERGVVYDGDVTRDADRSYSR